MCLLFPAWILIVPIFAFKRVSLDDVNIHLMIASGFMIIFMLTFKAWLGVYQDWNLFAGTGIAISLLVWRNVPLKDSMQCAVYYLGWMFFIHSYLWIISNHYYH